ncbi:hypothetical protein Tsubulata_003628 [Turnera subulata]|uniref:FAS1 domain-containing protein n=1 Tax=Turnera subulata TaxID=218843 RepID=A0A9Q0FGC6_9ROSI|nr:hypothetical protein Tsubulata_003628 [Turnera subulata]
MATTNHYFPLLFLLFLHLIHTATSTDITAPAPAPPPKSGGGGGGQQVYNIIDALIGAEDFKSWANFLKNSADLSILPLSATIFIPADDDNPFSSAAAATTTTPATIDDYIFPYHIVPQRLSFAELLQFKPLSRLPTLLPGKSILITNNSASNFTLDASLLSHPDLYSTSSLVFHGIANLLDYSVYGEATGKAFQSSHQMEDPPLPPPTKPSSSSSSSGSLMMGGNLEKNHHHYHHHHHHHSPGRPRPPHQSHHRHGPRENYCSSPDSSDATPPGQQHHQDQCSSSSESDAACLWCTQVYYHTRLSLVLAIISNYFHLMT